MPVKEELPVQDVESEQVIDVEQTAVSDTPAEEETVSVEAETVSVEDSCEPVDVEPVSDEAETTSEVPIPPVTENVIPIAKPKRRIWKRLMWTVIILVIIAAVLFGAFIAVSRIRPELLDNILYSKEELEILNHEL